MADVTAAGLTTVEATARRARDGANTLPAAKRPSVFRRLLGELTHFFAVLLWAAAAMAFFAKLPQLSVAIIAVIVLNGVFALIQQARADRAADRLQEMLPTRVTVFRDGRRRLIEAEDVVVDDVLLLESGDRVPADAVVLAENRLLVDSSMLTGESQANSVAEGEALFAGTFVVEGDSRALVTAIGEHTRLAGIARLSTSTAKPDTPLTRGLNGVVRLTAAISVSVGVLFLLVSLLIGNPVQQAFVFAIGVTVALVPEALLPTVTLSLAWGSELMAKRQILVRNLEAVETLGSTTFICTDKTGTLTRNQMTVVETWTPAGTVSVDGAGYGPTATLTPSAPEAQNAARTLALAAERCSTGYAEEVAGQWRAHGDPMEAALDALARRLGVDTAEDRRTGPAELRFPFDPRLRRMAVVLADEIVVKGAPDAVLPLCGDDPTPHQAMDALTARGLRVLAVAAAPRNGRTPRDQTDCEQGLRLLGLVALQDPPRDDVSESLRACRTAGVKVAMVTGDHPATATAIADEVGLRFPDSPVLSGTDLPDDERQLAALLDHDGVVIARVSPEDKLRIARALRSRGHVMAMTGDGVNDAPALHESDIGVAMGLSGTDVARGRRPGAARRLLRRHRRRHRAGTRDLRQHPTLPHLPPDRQRRRTGAVSRLGALRRILPAGARRPADHRARPRHRHSVGGRAGRRTTRQAPAGGTARAWPADEPDGAAPGLRSAGSAGSGSLARRLRRVPTGLGLAPRESVPRRARAGRGVRCGLHHRRPGPDGQRVRLPIVLPVAGSAGVVHQPVAGPRGPDRAGDLAARTVGATDRAAAGPVESTAVGMDRGTRIDADPARGRRAG